MAQYKKSDDEGQMTARTDVQELIKAVKKRDHQMLSTPSGNHQHLTSTQPVPNQYAAST